MTRDLDLMLVRERWPEIVARASAHPPTRPVIVEAEPIEIEHDCLVIGLPEAKPWLIRAAERRATVITEAASTVLGARIAVLIRPVAGPRPGGAGPVEPLEAELRRAGAIGAAAAPANSSVNAPAMVADGACSGDWPDAEPDGFSADREGPRDTGRSSRSRPEDSWKPGLPVYESPPLTPAQRDRLAEGQRRLRDAAERRRTRASEERVETEERAAEQSRLAEAQTLDYLRRLREDRSRPVGGGGILPVPDDWREQE